MAFTLITRKRWIWLTAAVATVWLATQAAAPSRAAGDGTGCAVLAGRVDPGRFECVDSLDQAGGFVEPQDLNEEDAVECVLRGDPECVTFPDGRAQHWELKHIYFVNPTVTTLHEGLAKSKDEPIYACEATAKRTLTAFWVPGSGTAFSEFGFLPFVSGEREVAKPGSFFSDALLGLLGDITFKVGEEDSWQVGIGSTVTADPWNKAWLEMSPAFKSVKAQMVLHMQYRWDGTGAYHHRDFFVPEGTAKVPASVEVMGTRVQEGVAVGRQEPLTAEEKATHCG